VNGPAPRLVRRFEDSHGVCRGAAEEFLESQQRARHAGHRFRVALAGGSTPRHLHQLLCSSPYAEEIAWNEIDFFFGDERTVAADHPDSNYRMARETLFVELEIPPNQIHRMPADAADLDAAAKSYEAVIADVFGVPGPEPGGNPPRFDLILLGIGSDGHTASLFPDTSALDETVRWVVKNRIPKLDTSRMTFTYPLINAAQKILFLISGEEKALALKWILEGDGGDSPCPARRIAPSLGQLIFLVDREAAGQLTPDTITSGSSPAT
jgi:6-phosphogluconolactonase